MILQVLQGVVGFLASVVTIGQMFTGVFMCRVIYRKGSTKNIPSMPFIGGLSISLLVLQQGYIIGDMAMNIVNVFGILINSAYILFYYLWSKKKYRDILVINLAKCMLAVGLLLLYANFEDPEKVEARFGFIVSLVITSFIAAPLLDLPKIMETQSTEGLPYPMIITGLAVSSLWFLYSILIWNKVLLIQNLIGMILCGIQLSLFFIYPDKSPETVKKLE